MIDTLRILEIDEDGNPLDWELVANSITCPTLNSLEFPTAVTLCVTGQTSTEDYRTRRLKVNFMQGDDFEEPTYDSITWDWYHYPDPRLLNMRVPMVVNLTDILSTVRKPLIDQLKEMADALRAQYHLPRWYGEIPPEWVSGQALEGGTLIRQGYSYYWTRVDLTAEENTRSPMEEEASGHLVRFRLFNQDIPDLPGANTTIPRRIVLNQSDMESDRIYKYQGEIVGGPDATFFDFVPPSDFPIENVNRYDRFSVSNDDYRLIARVIDVFDVGIVSDPTTDPPTVLEGAKRLTFDPEWDGGNWVEGERVQMRFRVDKRRRNQNSER